MASTAGLGLGGRSVVVTGGASNLGRAIVLAMAAEGARVGLLDRDVEQSARTVAEAGRGGGDVFAVRSDLTDPDDVAAAVAAVVRDRGGIDVLVNNVGWSRPAWFADVPVDEIDLTIRLNLLSTIYATRAVLPVMVAGGGGSIVSVASDAAFGELRSSVYGAAKAGVVTFMKNIALEYGRKNIRCNVVAPGLVLPSSPEAVGTGSLWAIGTDTIIDEQGRADLVRATPSRRLSTPEDVAGAVLMFASDRLAGQLTGQVLSVSGGMHMPA